VGKRSVKKEKLSVGICSSRKKEGQFYRFRGSIAVFYRQFAFRNLSNMKKWQKTTVEWW
jgi:hypothetical protein